MNCQSARENFPALLDRRNASTSHPDARAHLANCPDCQREFAALNQTLAALDAMPPPQPSPRLRQNFYAMLEEEKHSAESVRAAAERAHRAQHRFFVRWILSPALGCILALGGFLAGTRFSSSAAQVAPENHLALQKKVDELQRKVDTMGQLVFSPLLQQGPVNDRLRDVMASANSDKPSDKVLDDLIGALAFDPSANVRLGALEALYPHADKEIVRKGVLAALPREQHPLVQLELIEFLVDAHDRDAAPVLERISQNESADRSVRDAAKLALSQL